MLNSCMLDLVDSALPAPIPAPATGCGPACIGEGIHLSPDEDGDDRSRCKRTAFAGFVLLGKRPKSITVFETAQ